MKVYLKSHTSKSVFDIDVCWRWDTQLLGIACPLVFVLLHNQASYMHTAILIKARRTLQIAVKILFVSFYRSIPSAIYGANFFCPIYDQKFAAFFSCFGYILRCNHGITFCNMLVNLIIMIPYRQWANLKLYWPLTKSKFASPISLSLHMTDFDRTKVLDSG